MAYAQYAHVTFDGTSKTYDYVIPRGMTVKAGDDALVYVSGQPKTVRVVDVSFTSTCKEVFKTLAAVVDPKTHAEREARTGLLIKIKKEVDSRLEQLRKQCDLQTFIQEDPTPAGLCFKAALLT